MKRIFILLILLSVPGVTRGNSLTITQVDTSQLFLKQKVNLYVNLSDNTGNPIRNITKENIRLYESGTQPGSKRNEIENKKITVEPFVNRNNGINFFLMIDNSGSMRQTMEGRQTKVESRRRIYLAKKTVASFLDSMNNPNDRVGLASYNTNYDSLSSPTANIQRVKNYLFDIAKPVSEEGYTEIYGSLSLAVYDFKKIRGRKVIILLTDGVNQPYYRLTGKVHDIFGKKTFTYKEPVMLCNEEGISVFPVYFGPRGGMKDRHLDEIAKETGGMVFSAHNKGELADVYTKIKRQILNEYLVSYPASMFPANRKTVRMVYGKGRNKVSSERYYFSGSVFGLPVDEIAWWLVLPLLLGLALFAGLISLKYENKNKGAYLELLERGVARVSTRMFSINSVRTVIGGTDNADMTIVGNNKNLKNSQATIVFDKKSNRFTLISKGTTKVNNRKISSKVLEPGDVIDVCGTTVIFDNNKI